MHLLFQCNVPIGSVVQYRRTGEDCEIPRCDCRADAENPCGGDDCINRMMMYECSPQVCIHADRCLNQRFAKRQYPAVIVEKSEGCGWGLKTQVDLKKVRVFSFKTFLDFLYLLTCM